MFEPQKWNKYVIEQVIKSNAKYAIYDMCLNTQERNIVDQKLWNLSKNLNKLVIKSAEHLSCLFNLQRIERWQKNLEIAEDRDLEKNQIPIICICCCM